MLSRIQLLKSLDSIAGRIVVPLAALLTPSRRTATGIISSILLIRPGGIGDAVHLVPAIRALRQQYPSARVTVLAERRNASVFQLCPEVSNVLLYDRSAELLTALRGRYDVVIDTEQWHRLSAVVARLTCAPVLIGFATNERSRLFTRPISYSHDDYEVESFFKLLAPLGIEYRLTTEPFLKVPAAAAGQAGELLSALDGKRFVTIFPGASIAERRWGAERYRRVAELLSDAGMCIVVVGGNEDQQQGDKIVAGGLGLNLAGRTSLVETAAVIQQSALLASGDSGVLHIAVGLGTPTVSLFGPGRARKWAPRDGRHSVINKELACSPCTTFGTTPPCPFDTHCMHQITVNEVARAITGLLQVLK